MRRPLLLCLVLLLASAAPAAAGPVPAGATWEEAYVEESGKHSLHVDVLKPKNLEPGRRTPVILNIGPYNGHGGQVLPQETPEGGPQNIYTELYAPGGAFDRGYTFVQADLRGFGGSSGCNDFGGAGEQDDVRRLVEWAAAQPWSTGKVGLWGKSYDAWTQVMALDSKPEGLAAAIVQAPVLSGYQALFQNGVHYEAGWYATPGLYQAIDAGTGVTTNETPKYLSNVALGTNPACYGANFAGATANVDRDTAFWRERELPDAAGAKVPVFWAHGFRDANTKPDQFMPVWATLTGPTRAWFGQFAHDRASKLDHIVGKHGFRDEALDFFDRYVAGRDVAIEDEPRTVVQDSDGRWRGEAQWPPSDAHLRSMPIKPGQYVDRPNNDAERGGLARATGVGAWSVTQPIGHDARIAGVPRVSVEVAATAARGQLVALLYDVDEEEGSARLVSRSAHALTLGQSKVDFDLYPNDWVLRKGHRLGLLLAGSDLDWYLAPHSGQTVSVLGGSLDVPWLRYERTEFVEGEEARAMSSERPIGLSSVGTAGNEVTADFPGPAEPMPASMIATGEGAYALPPAHSPGR